MSLCKAAVIPLLTHWSFCSLPLSHPYDDSKLFPSNEYQYEYSSTSKGASITNSRFGSRFVDLCFGLILANFTSGFHASTHYSDVMMSAVTFQITDVSVVCSTVCSGADQRKLAFVREIDRWPSDSPHKGPVTRKIFPFGDLIMKAPVMQSFDDVLVLNLCNVIQTIEWLLKWYALAHICD